MKLVLASPRGFCAGVQRAVTTVEECLNKFGTQIYINHEIVHNRFVVDEFKKRGVIFTDKIEEIPAGAVFIISAHGVSDDFKQKALDKNLRLVDATCPLVNSVHLMAEKLVGEGAFIFYIGQKNHQESLGFYDLPNFKLLVNLQDVENLNQTDYAGLSLAVLTQTTLSQSDTAQIIAALIHKFPKIKVNNNICYATQLRQNAVKDLAQKVDGMIIIGSANSSNSNKLVSVAKKYCDAVLCENETMIPDVFYSMKKVGISAGASVPEILVNRVIDSFKTHDPKLEVVVSANAQENVVFSLPDF